MLRAMRHATVNGIRAIYEWVTPGEVSNAFSRGAASLNGTADRYACNWELTPLSNANKFFTHADGKILAQGIHSVELPTCPMCAVLVDAALEMRGKR